MNIYMVDLPRSSLTWSDRDDSVICFPYISFVNIWF